MISDLASAGQFLAYVEFVKDELPNRFARLRPIYDVDATPWATIVDGRTTFADEGLVFWWQPPHGVAEHTVWVVSLQLQPSYGADSRHRDKYAVLDAKRPYQGLVLQDALGPLAFRRALASGHLSFDLPLVGRPLVKVPQSDHWVLLPESVRTQSHASRYLVSVPGLEGVIPKYAMAADHFQSVVLENSEISLTLELGPPDGFQCALSDSQLIEHMRKRLSAIDRSVLDGLGITKSLLREYAGVIDAAGIGGDDTEKEEIRRHAITGLVESYESDIGELEAVVAALMEYPQIKQGVESRLADELAEFREARQREIEDEQTSAVDELAHTRAEVERTSHELQALRDGVRGAIRDITDAPLEALARHGLLDALKRAVRLDWVAEDQPAEVSAKSANRPIALIEKTEDLTKAVVGWASSVVVDPYMMQVALATILAHRVSLVLGPSADRVALAIASVIAADRSVRVSVSTTTFGVSDLLDSPITPVAATSAEGIATLGDFLSTSSEDECSVVVLSGCNRAPLEAFLPELLLPCQAGASAFGWKRDDGRYKLLSLPRRLKIIGTLYGGDATYRVSTELGTQLAVVPSDHEEMSGVALADQSPPNHSRIAGPLYDALTVSPEGYDPSYLLRWTRASGVSLAEADLASVFAVYLKLIKDPERAIGEAIAAMILGRSPSPKAPDQSEKNYEKVFSRLNQLSQAQAWQRISEYFNTASKE